MLGRGVDEVIRRVGPEYPLELLSPLTRQADLFFANLEAAISPRPLTFSGAPKTFYFRGEPAVAETLADAGVDLVSLANNHALDADYAGLHDTLAILREHGIRQAGAGPDLEAARRPAIVEAKNQSLGVLAYCDHQPDFAATADQPGIRYLDVHDPQAPAILTRDIAALAERVDHVIVAFHWQPNWAPIVRPRYRELGRRMIEAGARIVWGHSPHHFQGVERIGRGAILYASGDFLDDYAIHPEYRNDRQLLFQVALSDAGVEDVRAYPIELEYAHPHAAGDEARQWIAERFQRMCGHLGNRVETDGDWLRVV